MKKVLVINTIGMGYEGISSVIMNYLFHMKHDELEFQVIIYDDTPEEIIKKIEKLGKIYKLPLKKKNLRGYINGYIEILKNDCPNVVHVHGNSGTMMIESCLAKIYRVPKVIVHCHNTSCNHPFLNKLMVPIMKHNSEILLSCSQEAGKWLYGNAKFIVLNNAIDVKKYEFNGENRVKIRKDLGLEKKFVLGHIGHFTEQKNQEFLIDILSNMVQKQPNVKLLLVGDGPMRSNIWEKVLRLGLEENVIFAGNRKDPENMYLVMDLFLLPSKWEGVPLVLIEAQASGLECIVSDNLSEDIRLTESVKFCSLNNTDMWEQLIEEHIMSFKQDRLNYSYNNMNEIRKKKYDIIQESNKLREIYLS